MSFVSEKKVIKDYSNRKLILATKHRKELAIKPILEKSLNVQVFVPDDFDTDVFGTFTNEIKREGDPLITLKNKCLAAMNRYGYDLGVASEGSFGLHPFVGIPADDEMVVFIDRLNGLEIIGRNLSTETNYAVEEVGDLESLRNFASRILFPSHAMILRSKNQIVKGLTDWSLLKISFERFLVDGDTILAEADMRAMYNPTRMKVIKGAVERLIEKLHSFCPNCGVPGYSVTNFIDGLPCRLCSLPTRSALRVVYSCIKCGHSEERQNREKAFEEPMYCDHCNP